MARGVVVAVLAAVVTTLPMWLLAWAITAGAGPIIDLDHALTRAGTDLARAHPALREALLIWQALFRPWLVYPYTIPLLVYAWRRGLRERTAWALATMLVGWNLGYDVKLIVRRARPVVPDPVSVSPGFSFPSGHVFDVTLALVCCLILAWPLMRAARTRAAAIATAAALVVLTALDRILLGVHHCSDTVGAVLLALGLAAAAWAGWRAYLTSGRATRSPRGRGR